MFNLLSVIITPIISDTHWLVEVSTKFCEKFYNIKHIGMLVGILIHRQAALRMLLICY